VVVKEWFSMRTGADGYTMELRVRQGVQISQPVQQLVVEGTIKLINF
jgi:hypothetical protein